MQVGYVEAGTKEAAINILSGHDLFILSLESAEKIRWFDRLGSYFGGVKRKDMVIFTRQLATLLEARLPLKESLRTLYEQTSQPILREAVYQIIEDIDAGLSLSQAMERQGTVFSQFFISMIQTAEVTGNLDEVVGFLADYTEKDSVLITKARSALIYPGIIIGLFGVVAIIMVTSVFPQLGPVFEQSDVKLPAISSFLINSGNFISTWWPVLILLLFTLVIMALDYLRTEEGRAFWDDLKIRLPLLGKIYLPITIARVANTASILLKGGVPVAQALEIVSNAVDNVLYRDFLREVSDAVRQGQTISQSMAKYPDYFPPLVSQMLAVGESTGRLDQIFTRLSTFYSREADNVINNIVDLIQPILMIGIGIMVALLFASILLPLYQLTSSFR